MEISQQRNEKIDIVILVNGPGELSSYVRPTVKALIDKRPDLRITLVLTPCPYSTGKEVFIAKNIPGVTNVVSANEFINWVLFRKSPRIEFSNVGVVVFLGGDVLYGKILAKKLGFPAVAYSEAFAKWPKIYRKFLVPDQYVADKFKDQGFPADQIITVGNLMVDSIDIKTSKIDMFTKFGLDADKRLVSFLPGSRGFQVGYTFSFYPKIIEEMEKLGNTYQYAYIISPYLPERIFKKELYKAGFTLSGDTIEYKGIKVRIISTEQHEAIAASALVVTIPGTNTAEVAIIGTPMISFFPLGSFGVVPLEGIWELIGKLPVLGYFFRKYYVKMLLKTTRFFALPNKKSGKELVPELNGDIKPVELAKKAVSMLNDRAKLQETSMMLRTSLGSKGAAIKIAEAILSEVIH